MAKQQQAGGSAIASRYRPAYAPAPTVGTSTTSTSTASGLQTRPDPAPAPPSGSSLPANPIAIPNSVSTTMPNTSGAPVPQAVAAGSGTVSTTSNQATPNTPTLWSRVVAGWQLVVQGITLLGIIIAIVYGIWTWWLAYKADKRADWTSEQQLKQSCLNDQVRHEKLRNRNRRLTLCSA